MVRDVSVEQTIADCEPQPFTVTSNSQIYHYKDRQKIFKLWGGQREIEMMIAAGDCSIQPLERVFQTIGGTTSLMGFTMKRETPLDVKKIDPTRKSSYMHDMISCVQSLHNKRIIHGDIKPANMLLCSDSKIRLCDFAEAKPVDEDPAEWAGQTTLNYSSPHRCQQNRGYPEERYSAPVVEDDLFALGLSVWELWKREVPFDDVYCDDIYQMISEGKTVDVEAIGDEEARQIIWGYLRGGGATTIARY
ncbi:kinase-like protein [Stipitochalara longipes BDJ]|nr:kinase-like protein [Stipitochalara longipes BDJ]